MSNAIRVERHREATWLIVPPGRAESSSDGTMTVKLSPLDVIRLNEQIGGALGGLAIFALGTRDPVRDQTEKT
jgi:hypothetical protein